MKKALFIGIYILILFATLELTLRGVLSVKRFFDIEMWRYRLNLRMEASDARLSHKHIPGAKAKLYGVDIDINSKGLRDREFEYKKNPGTERILFLGDSLTLGWGVPFEFIFTKLLEKELTSFRKIRTEVINAGVVQYNSEQEFTYYKTEGYKYDSDLVMLLYFINDAEPTPIYSEPDLMEHSILFVFLYNQINRIRIKFDSTKNFYEHYSSFYRPGNNGWSDAQKSLLSLKKEIENNGKKFVVAVCPELRKFKNKYIFSIEHKKIMAFLRDSNINHIDLLPVFQKGVDVESKVWVSREDSHPNILGHRIIANGIKEFLIKRSNQFLN